MTDEQAIVVRHDGPVAVVTLNRPGKLNALTPQMQRRYSDVLRELDASPGVRVVVVTGAGRGFCSGADLGSLTDPERLRSYAPDPEALPTIALETGKPIVAAVNGPVAGIGFALMLACDVRFLSAQARVGTTFARLGLVAEYGLSWLLPRVVGAGRALELLMSGRAVDAEEALRIGLANEIVSGRPVLERAMEWAHDVAAHCSPRSLAAIKRQVYTDLDSSRGESLGRSLSLMVESFSWGDLAEALAARSQGREPEFHSLDAERAQRP